MLSTERRGTGPAKSVVNEWGQWFIDSKCKDTFAKWLIPTEIDYNVRAVCPFYLVKSSMSCWRCGVETEVITFACEGIEDSDDANDDESNFTKFQYVTCLSPNLNRLVAEKYLAYFIDYSNTTRSFYYMNHCKRCAAVLGDHFLHNEPGGAFFPEPDEARERVELVELKSAGYVSINADSSMLFPSFIEMGSRISRLES